MHDRWSVTRKSSRKCTSGEDVESFETRVRSMTQESNGPQSTRNIIPVVVLQGIVIIEVFTLHRFLIKAWFEDPTESSPVSMLGNVSLAVFYTVYIMYLAVTALQTKYDIHTTQGGLAFTHRTDYFSFILFRIYSVVPFVEELRVLIDWGVTTTAMNFFQWMKLEDLHQSLYKVDTDMRFRAELPPAAKRPLQEKLLQGGGLFAGLLIVLVGPISFFSSLNFSLVPNVVESGTLMFSIQVSEVSGGVGHRSLQLYKSGQSSLAPPNQKSSLFQFHDFPIDIQTVSFPVSSESYWSISAPHRRNIVDILENPNLTHAVKFIMSYHFERSSQPAASGYQEMELTQAERVNLGDALLSDSWNMSVEIPHILRTTLRLSSSDTVTITEEEGQSVYLQLVGNDAHQHWTLSKGQGSGNCTVCPLEFTLESDRVAPVGGNSSSKQQNSSSPLTVVGLYFGMVLTVGRFLRIAFQDSSKRMIYDELPDTALLTDLCNGIHIARIQGVLQTEYQLYYELIRIYRSPEILLHIAQPKRMSVTNPTVPRSATSSKIGRVPTTKFYKRNSGAGRRKAFRRARKSVGDVPEEP